MEKPRRSLPGLFRERGRFFAVSYFLLAPGNELSPAGSPTWLRPGAELVLGLVAPGMELSLAGAPVVAVPFFIFVLAGASAPGADFGCELSAKAAAGIATVAAIRASVESFIQIS
jgi:hypothetical protein